MGNNQSKSGSFGHNISYPFPISTFTPPPEEQWAPPDPKYPPPPPPPTTDQPIVMPDMHLQGFLQFAQYSQLFKRFARADPVLVADLHGELPQQHYAPDEISGQVRPSYYFEPEDIKNPVISLNERLLPSLRPPYWKTLTQEQKDRLFERHLPRHSSFHFADLRTKINPYSNDRTRRSQVLDTVVHGTHFNRGRSELVYGWGYGKKNSKPGEEPEKMGEFAMGSIGGKRIVANEQSENSKPK